MHADFDLKSPEIARDPYPAFTWLRDRDPVHWSESLGAWVVTRYADVLEIWNRPEAVAVVLAWGLLGALIAARRFRWEPREG